MKTIFLLAIACGYALSTYSQQEWYYFPDEIYFVKEVPAKEFRGKDFKYQIAVKVNASDTFSKVRINGVGVGKGADDFINNSNFVKAIQTDGSWTIYTIEGKVPKEAWKLWFYSAVNGNGDFYFDDLCFYIREEGEWIQVELPYCSFENKSKNIFQGFYVSARQSAHMKTEISKSTSFHGEQSLHVSTFGLNPSAPKTLLTRQ